MVPRVRKLATDDYQKSGLISQKLYEWTKFLYLEIPSWEFVLRLTRLLNCLLGEGKALGERQVQQHLFSLFHEATALSWAGSCMTSNAEKSPLPLQWKHLDMQSQRWMKKTWRPYFTGIFQYSEWKISLKTSDLLLQLTAM